MPRKEDKKKDKKEKKKKLEETFLKQNYVDEEDLIPFLRDRFGEDFLVETLDDGSKRVQAPRKLSDEEIAWLRELKEKREPRPSVFSYPMTTIQEHSLT